jgi:hypothetical protein
MDAEVSTHTFLTLIIEESVSFMSCEPILFFCNYSYVVLSFFLRVWTAVLLCRRTPAYYGRIVVKTLYTPAPTKSCAAFKNVRIHRCVQKYAYMYTRIYIFFLSTEHCARAIISPKEFQSCVRCISFALLYWKTELSAVKYFAIYS